MAILIYDLPRGCAWGFFCDARRWMHLTPMSAKFMTGQVVRLERGGRWTFEPQAPMPAVAERRLRDKVLRKRAVIEEAWVRNLIARGWLRLEWSGSRAELVVHPETENERRVLLPKREAARRGQPLDLHLEIENAALVTRVTQNGRVVAQRRPLADLLWPDRPEGERL